MKIKNIQKVSGRLPIGDPYIMGASHYDKYPEGNGKFGPKASLEGRNLGNDFDNNATKKTSFIIIIILEMNLHFINNNAPYNNS